MFRNNTSSITSKMEEPGHLITPIDVEVIQKQTFCFVCLIAHFLDRTMVILTGCTAFVPELNSRRHYKFTFTLWRAMFSCPFRLDFKSSRVTLLLCCTLGSLARGDGICLLLHVHVKVNNLTRSLDKNVQE